MGWELLPDKGTKNGGINRAGGEESLQKDFIEFVTNGLIQSTPVSDNR